MKHLISLKTNQSIASVEDYQNGRIDGGDVIGVVLQTETIGMVILLTSGTKSGAARKTAKYLIRRVVKQKPCRH